MEFHYFNETLVFDVGVPGSSVKGGHEVIRDHVKTLRLISTVLAVLAVLAVTTILARGI